MKDQSEVVAGTAHSYHFSNPSSQDHEDDASVRDNYVLLSSRRVRRHAIASPDELHSFATFYPGHLPVVYGQVVDTYRHESDRAINLYFELLHSAQPQNFESWVDQIHGVLVGLESATRTLKAHLMTTAMEKIGGGSNPIIRDVIAVNAQGVIIPPAHSLTSFSLHEPAPKYLIMDDGVQMDEEFLLGEAEEPEIFSYEMLEEMAKIAEESYEDRMATGRKLRWKKVV